MQIAAESGLHVGNAHLVHIHTRQQQCHVLGDTEVLAIPLTPGHQLQRCGPVVVLLPDVDILPPACKPVEVGIYTFDFLPVIKRAQCVEHRPPAANRKGCLRAMTAHRDALHAIQISLGQQDRRAQGHHQ